jgi:hypothetical protein
MEGTLKKYALLLATTSLALSPLNALAADDGSGLVFGVGVGYDQSNLDDFIEGTGGPSASSPDAELGTDIYIGFAANQSLTVRFGHRRFGDAESEVFNGLADVDLEADGFYAAVDLLFPVTDRFFVGGTLGNQGIDAARNFYYGARAKWLLGESSALTAAYNLYSFEVDDAGEDIEYDTLAVGLEWRF